ncbi:sodium-dependent transporter [Candidatus Margulisiibacteriota bacterium]
MKKGKKKREVWNSKLGVILAVAGSAVGLGNFLRFPVQAAQNGGGAFMIPYFISLLLLGIPLMWIEWTAGRFGGIFGHGTAPGIFHAMWRNRFIKYFGIIGIFGPLVILIYYTYIESWLLGYSFFALTGKYLPAAKAGLMPQFLQGYQGVVKNQFFQSIRPAYFFFVITFLLNFWVIKRGISKGIEWLSKLAMPVLFTFGFIILIRVFTLGTPDAARPSWNIINGLGFLWNPDFSALLNAKVWLAAAGQVFFTLSVGIGMILTYASYLKKEDDVVLSGLTSVSTNEMAEVVLGGSIVIPAAVAFFGPMAITQIAASGAFNLGFVTMPLIFTKIAFGQIFAFMWFALLFLAGVTSSISLAQPVVAFMEDEFDLTREKAVWILGFVAFILCQPAIFFLGNGVVDELDFWGGTFGMVLFATIETVLFAWIFGMDKAWKEIHHGAELEVPKIYRFIIKYVTPFFLFAILGFWLVQQGVPFMLMKDVPAANIPYVLATRIGLLVMLVVLAILVKIAWRKKRMAKKVDIL